jgi:hypothetical protein
VQGCDDGTIDAYRICGLIDAVRRPPKLSSLDDKRRAAAHAEEAALNATGPAGSVASGPTSGGPSAAAIAEEAERREAKEIRDREAADLQEALERLTDPAQQQQLTGAPPPPQKARDE